MKSGDIQLQLSATNRWWQTAQWERDDPDLRAAAATELDYHPGSLADLTPGGLYVLRGPRRVGKSTEIKRTISNLITQGTPPRAVVHAAVDGWRAQDLRALVTTAARTFLPDSEQRYWFIDEITSVHGDWPNVIKNLRDNDPQFARDTVVLTGSSAARLHEARKALAGRRGPATNADRTLLPMRFGDFTAAAAGVRPDTGGPIEIRDLTSPQTRERVTAVLPHLADLVSLWESYLRVGGFPQAVASWRRTGSPDATFVDALWDVIYGDAINDARLAAVQALGLLAGLARNLCSPLNVADLARDLDVAQPTASERLDDLAEHFMAWPCYRAQGTHVRAAAQRKWYFTDPLVARLAALRGAGAEPDLTQLSEQQVGVALLRTVCGQDTVDLTDFDAVRHHRTPSGTEIDFVGPRMGSVAVESKYTDGPWGRELRRLHQGSPSGESQSRAPQSGVVASRSGVEWHDNGAVLPAPVLALLLGA